jgi:hypothetical protein
MVGAYCLFLAMSLGWHAKVKNPQQPAWEVDFWSTLKRCNETISADNHKQAESQYNTIRFQPKALC